METRRDAQHLVVIALDRVHVIHGTVLWTFGQFLAQKVLRFAFFEQKFKLQMARAAHHGHLGTPI